MSSPVPARAPTAFRPGHRPGLWQLLDLWRQRRRGRLALSRLDDRLRDDIGVGTAAARRESARPFWLP